MPAEPVTPFRLRTTDLLPSTADLVVAGAGVVGCATAFRAARAGFRTVVLDARPRPATLTTPAATGAYRQQVTGLRTVGGRIVAVETHDGAVAAPLVVLATGPFLGRTAALAGVDVPIAPTRRQKVVVADAPEVPADAPMTIDEATGAHWRPALRGAFVLLTEPGTPATDPTWSVPTSADFAFRLLDPASPDSVAAVAPRWADARERGINWLIAAGQYEHTPDHRPF